MEPVQEQESDQFRTLRLVLAEVEQLSAHTKTLAGKNKTKKRCDIFTAPKSDNHCILTIIIQSLLGTEGNGTV